MAISSDVVEVWRVEAREYMYTYYDTRERFFGRCLPKLLLEGAVAINDCDLCSIK